MLETMTKLSKMRPQNEWKRHKWQQGDLKSLEKETKWKRHKIQYNTTHSYSSLVAFRLTGLVNIQRKAAVPQRAENLHSLCCLWHYVFLSQYEASRERERCNQYLLVFPSDELDFTIRSACSPDSTSNIISWLDMSCTDVAD